MVATYIFIFLFGLIIGSFLNCLIWRLYRGESLLGRSYCPKCGKQISWYDNIPLLSFILLKGKCRLCGQAISWQYPLVELTAGILFVMAFYLNQELGIRNQELNIFTFIPNSLFLLRLLYDCFFISVMIVIFIYDLRWYMILDIITLPACAIIFILNIFLGLNWLNLLISGIIISSFFLVQFVISRGRWIGGGDIRLGLLIGLALGWPDAIVALFLAYFIGSIIGLSLILAGRKQLGSQVPLGVFLSTASIITLFYGRIILDWYLGLF